MTALDVIAGRAIWSAEHQDALAWLTSLPDDSVSLCLFSPPYSSARLYLESGADLGIARDTETWVAWMVQVVRECVRVCTGLIAIVCDDQTQGYRYGFAPYLLMADLHRAGYNLRRPCVYRRVGIPGSGGPDWFRADHEPIICVTRPGRLPWSDSTACGHPPRWAPGGEMSHRLKDGDRVNEWGMKPGGTGMRRAGGKRRTHGDHFDANALPPAPPDTDLFGQPLPEGEVPKKNGQHRRPGTDNKRDYHHGAPVLANPGTVVQRLYTAREVADLLGVPGDLVDVAVGGGQMGDKICHSNEAPYPEALVERFVRSFAPVGSVVADPFCGSGTTLKVAVEWNRRAVGCDLRQSQVELTRRRLAPVTPLSLLEGDR